MPTFPLNIPTVVVIGLVVLLLVAQALRVIRRKRLRELNVKTRDKMVAITSVPNEYVPVEVASVPRLNQKMLGEYTTSLERLGFERLLDYRLRQGENTELRGFERVFGHPNEKCFAGIMAAGAIEPDKPLYVAINSHMEDGWRLGTSNIPARKADYFLRQPRILRMRYPDDPIEKLFERHLQRRGEILRDLGIKVLPDVSIEAYIARATEAAEQRKTKVQTANPLGDLPLAEAQASARNQEWLGDYPAEAERLRAEKKLVTS